MTYSGLPQYHFDIFWSIVAHFQGIGVANPTIQSVRQFVAYECKRREIKIRKGLIRFYDAQNWHIHNMVQEGKERP